MAWDSLKSFDDCLIGQRYHFDKLVLISAIRMAWFEEDELHTAVVDKESAFVMRTFQSGFFMGLTDECELFKLGELPEELLNQDPAKAVFIGQAEEDDKWYSFISVNAPHKQAVRFDLM